MTFTARTETYVNVSSLTTPFNITVTRPTGTVDGDILFCWIGWYAAVTIDSVPSGWNLLGEYLANTDRYALYYKIAASEPASWIWSFTATAKVRAVCSCYTSGDFDPSNPINVVSNTAYRTSNANCRAATMPVAAPNSPMIFWGGIYSANSTRSFTKPSVPTSDWVEDDDYWNTTADFGVEVCSMIWSSSGATGDMIATISSIGTTKHAFAVALNPPSPSLPFKDGFDDGTFDAWDNITTFDAGCTATTVATPVHHGNKAAQFLTDGTGEYAFAYKTFTDRDSIYVRIYLNAANLPPISGYHSLMWITDFTASKDIIQMDIINNDPQQFRIQVVNIVATEYYAGDISIAVDEWHCIETYLHVGDADGEVQVWYDGNSIIHETNKDTNYGSTSIDSISIGIVGGSEGNTKRYDCVVADSSYIGLEGPTPNAFNKIAYLTEPPSPGWNKVAYESEPPVSAAWNKIKYG